MSLEQVLIFSGLFWDRLMVVNLNPELRLNTVFGSSVLYILTKVFLYCKVQPFKRQHYKMVKHTQTIRWLLPTNCLSVVDHFAGLALKGLS